MAKELSFLAVICLSAHVIGCILEMRSCLKLELSSLNLVVISLFS